MSANISNLKYTTNVITVQAIYEANSAFNSATTVINIGTQHVPKLSIPQNFKKENISDDEVVLLDKDGNELETVPIITGVKFTWNAVENAQKYIVKVEKNVTGIKITLANGQTIRTYLSSMQLSVTTTYYEKPASSRYHILDLETSSGTYNVSVQAAADIQYDGEQYTSFDSDFSEAIQEIVTDIDPIEDLEWDDSNEEIESVFTWTLPKDGDYIEYDIIPSAGSVPSFTLHTEADNVDVREIVGNENRPATYSIRAWALSFDKFRKRPSAVSTNTLTYQNIKLGKPTNLSWEVETSTVHWNSVSGATHYDIYEITRVGNTTTEEKIGTTEVNKFTYPFDTGVHELYVIATRKKILNNKDVNENANPRYIASDASATYSFGTIGSTILSRNGRILTWNEVPDRYRFELYENNILINADIKNLEWQFGKTPIKNEIGTWTYKIRAVASDADIIGPFSNEVSFTISKLDTPTLQEITGTSKYYWNAINGATNYLFYVSGDIYGKYTSNMTVSNPLVIQKFTRGNYSMFVQAVYENTEVPQDTFLIQSSDNSNTINYVVKKLATPVIEYDSGDINWYDYSDDDANSYSIYIKDDSGGDFTLLDTTSFKTYTPVLEDGTYQAKIMANRTGQVSYPNPYIISSEYSNVVSFGKLGKPTISIVGNILQWDPVQFSEYYIVYRNGEIWIPKTNTTNIELMSFEPWTYTYQVRAVNEDPNMYDDDSISNIVSYTFYKIETPEIWWEDNTTLKWFSVPTANKYYIYWNGILLDTVTNNSYNTAVHNEVGINTFYLVADNDLANYLKSNNSNELRYIKKSKYKYVLKINDVEYEAWVPFDVQKNLDGSLDTASISTAPMDRKLPFEKDTKVEFYVFDDTLSVILDNHQYVLLVDIDEVQEIQIGTKTHNNTSNNL